VFPAALGVCIWLSEEGEGWKQEFWSGKDHCEWNRQRQRRRYSVV